MTRPTDTASPLSARIQSSRRLLDAEATTDFFRIDQRYPLGKNRLNRVDADSR